MIRISHALFLMMAVWCAGLLVWTSQSVQKTEKELNKIQHHQLAEIEATRVLMSEWEYLNRPERLDALINNFDFVANKKIAEEKFLLSINEIKDPVVPAIPKVKPDSLLKRASVVNAGQNITPIVKAPTAQNNFNNVIDGLLENEGAQ